MSRGINAIASSDSKGKHFKIISCVHRESKRACRSEEGNARAKGCKINVVGRDLYLIGRGWTQRVAVIVPADGNGGITHGGKSDGARHSRERRGGCD